MNKTQFKSFKEDIKAQIKTGFTTVKTAEESVIMGYTMAKNIENSDALNDEQKEEIHDIIFDAMPLVLGCI